MKVLVACEFSGIVRDAFARMGHDAWSCDLIESETPGQHYQDDVANVLARSRWDLLIAHPPCTYLALSGVRWLYTAGAHKNLSRWQLMDDAARFFTMLLNASVPRIAVENPRMHRYALAKIGMRPTQIVQPWEFDEGETKATCLWLLGLPPLMATVLHSGRIARVHRMPPSPERWKNRSRTSRGIAAQMARQWGMLTGDTTTEH